MKTRTKLLVIVGSQRKNGNSYSLAKTVLESFDVESEIVQLADKEIEFCNLCYHRCRHRCYASSGLVGFDQLIEISPLISKGAGEYEV